MKHLGKPRNSTGNGRYEFILPEDFRSQWYGEWTESEPGRRYRYIHNEVEAIEGCNLAVSVYATGLLHLENIPPGHYWLTGTFMDPNNVDARGDTPSDTARVRCRLTVPAMDQQDTRFLNLGTLSLTRVYPIEVGNPAP